VQESFLLCLGVAVSPPSYRKEDTDMIGANFSLLACQYSWFLGMGFLFAGLKQERIYQM